MPILVACLLVLTMCGATLKYNVRFDARCPTVTVACASENCYSSPFQLKAQVIGAKPDQTLSYQWTVISGRIVEGQGTPSIRAVGDDNDLRNFTATVEVKGLPAECSAFASYSVIVEPPPPVREIAEFGSLPFQKLKSHLDDFASQLRNEPWARGYIVSSRTWALSGQSKQYLIKVQGCEPGRIVYVQKKAKRPLVITLYIVPAGAVPPDR